MDITGAQSVSSAEVQDFVADIRIGDLDFGQYGNYLMPVSS